MAMQTQTAGSLSHLFRATGGSGKDPLKPTDLGLDYLQSDSEFLKNFKTPYTGANGSGPILNANANLIPTRTDNYRDISSTLDYKLGNGLGVSTAYRKQDSMAGQTKEGFQGMAKPSKMFGRDSRSYDLNYRRDDMLDRARMSFKKMGFRPNEVPDQADYMPWQWNDNQALGIGGGPIGNPNQYNRNYTVPDADAVARRLYQPAPSRITQMMTTDVEEAALRPNSTLMNPITVVSNDRQREKLQRIPRNADVIESVLYHNIVPRSMGPGRNVEAPRVYSDANVLRRPVGTNDTGGRDVDGRWENGYSSVNPLLDSSLEDYLTMHKSDFKYVQGKEELTETQEFVQNQEKLLNQNVQDYNHIDPKMGLYPHNQSTINTPLVHPKGVGTQI